MDIEEAAYCPVYALPAQRSGRLGANVFDPDIWHDSSCTTRRRYRCEPCGRRFLTVHGQTDMQGKCTSTILFWPLPILQCADVHAELGKV